ncbi:MAG: sterol desaturase family protein [Nevskia sp.]|nr:sterol desaturase family protein [Nevskia sp.]
MESPTVLFKSRHGRLSYFADFAVYPLGIAGMSAFLLRFEPRGERLDVAAAVAGGLAGWSFLEYAMHRFVLHGPEPFRSWHLEHHRRPRALIGTPTVVSAPLLLVLVYLPALALSDTWVATGATLGVTTGYLGYAWTHYALHHRSADTPWLRSRKRLHSLHHARHGCEYGVTTSIWDRVFASRAGS